MQYILTLCSSDLSSVSAASRLRTLQSSTKSTGSRAGTSSSSGRGTTRRRGRLSRRGPVCIDRRVLSCMHSHSLCRRAGHLQIGGGITAENAREWLDAGASKVRSARGSPSYACAELGTGHRDFVPLPGRVVLSGQPPRRRVGRRKRQARRRCEVGGSRVLSALQ